MKRHFSDKEDGECCPTDGYCRAFCYARGLHKTKMPRSIDQFLISFLRLFDDVHIQRFLYVDSCSKIADRYLLAMVYVYFRRAGLVVEQYNKFTFFSALYLANV